MWHTEHTHITCAAAADVWRFYEPVEQRLKWEKGLSAIALDGAFAAGTSGTMTIDGQELAFTLIEVEREVRWADETPVADAGIVVRVIHRLDTIPEGTRITHRVEIDGDATAELGPVIGPQIAADFPDALRALAALAETV